MKFVALSKIFNIVYGNQLDLNKMELDLDNGVNFISRTRENLGVKTKVKRIDVNPFPPGCITVTLGGAYLLSSFVQRAPFYTAQNIKVLTPKQKMSFAEKLFYCNCIEKNRIRYVSHGREANKTLDYLLVPDRNEIPTWAKDLTIVPTSKDPLSKNRIDLDKERWKWFYIEDLFDVKGTKSITKVKIAKYGKGEYPYVVTSSENNGVEGFYDYFTEEGNVLTIDSATVGTCFYQQLNFSASDHVEKLIPKFKLNIYRAIFLVTIINLEQKRYGYGRKFAQKRIKDTQIKLPTTKINNPDWQFIENYIKTISYSSNL